MKLLTSNNRKLQRGGNVGYFSAGIHLAPATLSGFNTCPMASVGCAAACLNTSGHGRYQRTQSARIKKTHWFYKERESFMAQLVWDINAVIRKAGREGKIAAIRLNLTSDVQWENIEYQGKTIFAHFPQIQFYDYTKIVRRVLPGSVARGISNYHLTFSRSESNDAQCELALSAGANVAVVFHGKTLPPSYKGVRVVSGDETDLRFLDDKGVIVGLTTKGRAKKDTSGFVVSVS